MTIPQPPHDPDTADERLPGEAELAALYRQLPASEPPPALDAAVLRAAAQALAPDAAATATQTGHRQPAVATLPTRTGKPRSHWLIGLGSAAALVLAAGLAWRLHPSLQIDAPAPSAPVTDTVPAQTEKEMMAADVATPPPVPASAPMEPSPRLHAARAEPSRVPDAIARRTMANRKTAAFAPRTQAATAPAAAVTGTAADAPAGAPPLAPSMAQAAPAPAEAPPPLAEWSASTTDDTPAKELEKIRQLFADGHDDEARQRLDAFRQTYPQWQLPPELEARQHQP